MQDEGETKVKVELTYTELHILIKQTEGSGYPELLDKLNTVNEKAFMLRWSTLVKYDISNRDFKSLFYRILNVRSIRARYK